MHCASDCGEIRASNLSGECKWSQEFFRGMSGFYKHQQVLDGRSLSERLFLGMCSATSSVVSEIEP